MSLPASPCCLAWQRPAAGCVSLPPRCHHPHQLEAFLRRRRSTAPQLNSHSPHPPTLWCLFCQQVEAFYDGGVAVALFNMPVLLAFTMGFILKVGGGGGRRCCLYRRRGRACTACTDGRGGLVPTFAMGFILKTWVVKQWQ